MVVVEMEEVVCVTAGGDAVLDVEQAALKTTAAPATAAKAIPRLATLIRVVTPICDLPLCLCAKSLKASASRGDSSLVDGPSW
jgi:hypothetical protein